ncbi:MAG: efflux RND transporter periplasmic adaptor subunit [Candidatus Omnitrophota bacterium]|nr:efflux RND transporter periplasmic adaptor subunit [Candidatus Omnitrophota bacterium]
MRIIKLLAFCGIVFILYSCSAQEKPKRAVDSVIPVRIMKVAARDIFEVLEYVGDIKAKDEAQVYPKVSGKIIEKVKEDGALINKGEVILYIDRDEVGLKFEKAPVESPLSGIVGRIFVDIGANVSTQTAVALVVNMEKVKIELDIPEKYLPKISIGQEAKVGVDAFPQEIFTGQITKISPVLDTSTRSAPIEITINNTEEHLQSGMFANVNLIFDTRKNALVVLKEAIIGKEPETYVYTVQNNQAVLKKVAIGIRQGPYYEVREGLKGGELVVIMGQQRLKDGAMVNTEEY